jgi:hypothetical protein
LSLQAQDAAHTNDLIAAAKQWLFARQILGRRARRPLALHIGASGMAFIRTCHCW